MAAAWVLGLGSAHAQNRPQVDAATAATHTVADYLAQGPSPWQPPDFDAAALKPDFIVAADGSGTHRTVQAAVDAVPDGAARRHVIQIRPGTYRERLCVQGKGPLTLVGEPGDAAAVRLVEGRYNAQPKRPGLDAAHPCIPDLAAATHGTPGSASVVLASDDLIAAYLTVSNDAMDGVKGGVGYPPGAGESGGAQAVALVVSADRVLMHRVRLLGHQDTLMARRPKPDAPARVLVRASLAAGDVDFIFGNATLVIDDSTILSRAGRRAPGNGGHVLAPSTPAAARLGFLVTASRLVAEPGVPEGSISLGRAWDEGVARGAWQAGVSPNGQVLVRDSGIGPHIGSHTSPWAASTSRRPFSATGAQANRMAEWNNRTLPSDPARETLGPGDGWAAAEGGVSGGADAAPGDVFEVRNRAELAAALSGPARPRIVRVRGRIDLSVDDAGRLLGFEDYRDPGFDWAAFERAYDPATWGRKPPAGPLEEARQRSARRQAERVVLRVPSHTTLIGLPGAHLSGGGLLLEQVENVIVRNIRFSDAYDHFPAWDPGDNANGEWNSAYDTLTLRGATRVWIDHCSFDNGDRTDAAARVALGRRMQHHDGMLDIIRGSDLVTVSWNHFRDHDKTVLVGNSDRLDNDEGRLRVTFHHNHWDRVKERAPRVRFGRVHLFNNLHRMREDGEGYTIGVGHRSRIVSDSDAWETPPTVPTHRLLRVLQGSRFESRGALHNGAAVDLAAAVRTAHPERPPLEPAGWQPALAAGLEPAAAAVPRVRAGAGAGRLWTGH